MKKQNNNSGSKLIIIFLLITLIIIVGFIAIRVSKLPKRVCHTKEEIIRINLPRWNGWSNGDYFYSEYDEILCEDGINIYEYSRMVINFDMNVDKICLVKHKEEVCEIK